MVCWRAQDGTKLAPVQVRSRRVYQPLWFVDTQTRREASRSNAPHRHFQRGVVASKVMTMWIRFGGLLRFADEGVIDGVLHPSRAQCQLLKQSLQGTTNVATSRPGEGHGSNQQSPSQSRCASGRTVPPLTPRPGTRRAEKGSEEAWWARPDSNRRPTGYEPAALTAELRAPTGIIQERRPHPANAAP